MTFRHDGFNWIVRLDKGEKLIESLTGLISSQNIPNCWVSGIGGALSAELGFYDLANKNYNWKQFDQTMEIVSLSGNIVGSSAEPQFHLHGVFSDQNYQTIGGHIKDLVVGGTCELLLHKWYAEPINRKHNDDIGLNLLDL